jgi:hypothetical protein
MKRHSISLLVLASLIFAATPVLAARPPSESWTFTFRLENDLFANTDRLYTNGIKLSWISPDMEYFRDLEWLKKKTEFRKWTNRIINLLPFSRNPDMQRNIALSVGQQMFTPTDISRQDLISSDRPYAGWLYGGIAFHNKDDRVLNTIEIQAGLIGAWSLARETQDFIHGLRGIDKAEGWDNQLDNEFGFALIYDRKVRALRRTDFSGQWGVDVITHYGGAAGTVFTHVDTGLEVRLGWNLPTDFGTALIRPAGDTNAPADTKDPRYDTRGTVFSFHVFAAATGRLVLRDIFLDGNTFSHSHGVDKELLVGDFVIGASLVYSKVKVSYAQVLRTEEFRAQHSGHNFGSISISYTY